MLQSMDTRFVSLWILAVPLSTSGCCNRLCAMHVCMYVQVMNTGIGIIIIVVVVVIIIEINMNVPMLTCMQMSIKNL